MLFARPNPFPSLEKYLDRHPYEIEWSSKKMTYAILGGLCLLFSLVGVDQFERHVLLSLLWFFGLICLGIFAIHGIITHSGRTVPQAHLEALHAKRQLRHAKAGGALDRALPTSIGIVMEECAAAWIRVDECLAGPMWTDPALASHWMSIRNSAKTAAAAAMEEVFCLACPHLTNPNEARPVRSVQELVQRVIGTEARPITSIPASFRPAIKIAEQLQSLAFQVESATETIVAERMHPESPNAVARLENVLRDLRSIQVAEEELHIEN